MTFSTNLLKGARPRKGVLEGSAVELRHKPAKLESRGVRCKALRLSVFLLPGQGLGDGMVVCHAEGSKGFGGIS